MASEDSPLANFSNLSAPPTDGSSGYQVKIMDGYNRFAPEAESFWCDQDEICCAPDSDDGRE